MELTATNRSRACPKSEKAVKTGQEHLVTSLLVGRWSWTGLDICEAKGTERRSREVAADERKQGSKNSQGNVRHVCSFEGANV